MEDIFKQNDNNKIELRQKVSAALNKFRDNLTEEERQSFFGNLC